MDELFRFALSRSADRGTSAPIPLERSGSRLQARLEAVQTNDNVAEKWAAMRQEALDYLEADADALLLLRAFNSADDTTPAVVQARAELRVLAKLPGDLLKAVNGKTPASWPNAVLGLAKPWLKQDLSAQSVHLADLFIALMLFRSVGPQCVPELLRAKKFTLAELFRVDRPGLQDLAQLLRALDIIDRVQKDSAQFAKEAAIRAALKRTLLLPSRIFGRQPSPVHAVGVTDLLVVKQHIHHYELGEIARIENILKGEKRAHVQKHTLSNERETFFETETTTETEEELTSQDHVSIRNEAENILKEDTKVDAGVHAQYDGGSYKIQADVTVSYDRSSSEAKKSATEIAKDVTQRAARRVSERITQSTRSKVVEVFEETENQDFKNTSSKHVSGVYQWLQKVYLAQVFNYGRHLLFDVMVPEPAASLLQAAEVLLEDEKQPKEPTPLNISPLKLSDDPNDVNFYGLLVARYGVTGVEPPPPETITIAVSKDVPTEDDTEKSANDVVRINEGYGAQFARASVTWKTNDNTSGGVGSSPNDSLVNLFIGNAQLLFDWPTANDLMVTGKDRLVYATKSVALNTAKPNEPLEESMIGWVFKTNLVNGMTLNLEIICKRTQTALAKWKLQTYDKIAARYQKLLEDYETKLAALKYRRRQEGVLGAADPEMNRQTERVELKRSCIAILTGNRGLIDGLNMLTATPNPPTPNFWDPSPDSQHAGAVVRFLEQAFEWDKISYVLYPYFWGRADHWIGRLQRKHDDPLFEQFLKAGYARVVIPVRSNFEGAFSFFVMTGQPWMGGELPSIGDKTYLPIAEEIKEQTGAPGDEKPVGDPWFVRLATRIVKVRTGDEDKELPKWKREPAHFDTLPPDNSWNWVVDDS